MAARGWLMESEIIETLVRACEGNHYLREHGHRATMKTIESGLRDGLKVPHDDLEDRDDAPHMRTVAMARDHSSNSSGATKQEREAAARETGDWDDPDMSILDDRRGELPDLPIEVFPQSMHRWMLDAARGAGVTVGHVALPLIGIASGLIGMARRVQATRSWQQPMTCWACLVGVSGSGKTPSLDVIKRALTVVERSRQQENAARQLAHETRVERAKAALKKWKEDVAAAVDAGQPPPVKPAEAQDVRPFVVPRLYVSDCTIERLAPLLEARPRGVIYVADELARLFHEPRALSGGSDREFWLEAWDGNSFIVERLGRPPVILPHLLVGVVGGFQPDLLARSFAGDSDGIYSRFLYAWPPEAPFREPTDEADEVDPEIINAFGRLASLQAGDDEAFAPRSVPLTADARRHLRNSRNSRTGKAVARRARPRILVQGNGACAAPVRHAVFPRMGVERRCRAAGDRGTPYRERGAAVEGLPVAARAGCAAACRAFRQAWPCPHSAALAARWQQDNGVTRGGAPRGAGAAA